MPEHTHIHVHSDICEEKYNRIMQKLDLILMRGMKQMSATDDLIAEVSATKAGEDSAIVLLNGMFAQLQAAGNDPALIQQAVADLQAKRAELAAAVAADGGQSGTAA